jgi:hypothetical protein
MIPIRNIHAENFGEVINKRYNKPIKNTNVTTKYIKSNTLPYAKYVLSIGNKDNANSKYDIFLIIFIPL